MGVEYERWLLAKGAVFSPSAAAVATLVEKLRKERWIPEAAGARRAHRGQRLRQRRREEARGEHRGAAEGPHRARGWTIPRARSCASCGPSRATRREVPAHAAPGRRGLPTPSSSTARPSTCTRSSETIESAADDVRRAARTSASSGTRTRSCPRSAPRGGIFAECEACSRTFDPGKRAAAITNPFDGESEQVMGGAAYRFALKVDCGKCFVGDAALAFQRELVALVEGEFGRDFFEVGIALLEGLRLRRHEPPSRVRSSPAVPAWRPRLPPHRSAAFSSGQPAAACTGQRVLLAEAGAPARGDGASVSATRPTPPCRSPRG